MAQFQIFINILLFLLLPLNPINGFKEPHFLDGRTTIVNLFLWNWLDIAKECEDFLGPQGYAGVQISSPAEHLVLPDHPWWERYHLVSYKLTSGSGTMAELNEMIRRCTAVDVRIYVDLIINHMSGGVHNLTETTAYSSVNFTEKYFPEVPYTKSDFSPPCKVKNYYNAKEVRDCQLFDLLDLDQSRPNVRNSIADYMNVLIGMGVAGFHVDAAKHMWPEDLYAIFAQLDSLNSDYKFPSCARPYIYHEVVDYGLNEPIRANDYVLIGDVTEFKGSYELGRVFRGGTQLKYLFNWGPQWGLLATHNAFVFVDNEDNQRLNTNTGNGMVLTYKNSERYKMANIFMLAHPYGKVTSVMSSFEFFSYNEGPRIDANGTKNKSPVFLKDGRCDTQASGWICEHRWHEIANMIKFRNAVGNEPLQNWWDNGSNQIAFSRGTLGFIAINMEKSKEMKMKLQTGLPEGFYCDILGGDLLEEPSIQEVCTGQQLRVNESGFTSVILPHGPSAIVIYTDAKIDFDSGKTKKNNAI